jgi:hypothetical protein
MRREERREREFVEERKMKNVHTPTQTGPHREETVALIQK